MSYIHAKFQVSSINGLSVKKLPTHLRDGLVDLINSRCGMGLVSVENVWGMLEKKMYGGSKNKNLWVGFSKKKCGAADVKKKMCWEGSAKISLLPPSDLK